MGKRLPSGNSGGGNSGNAVRRGCFSVIGPAVVLLAALIGWLT